MDQRSSSYEREGVLQVIEKNVLANNSILGRWPRIRQRVFKWARDKDRIWTLCFLHVEYGRRAAKEGSVEVLVE